jgi:carboxyl-terminal processing protease
MERRLPVLVLGVASAIAAAGQSLTPAAGAHAASFDHVRAANLESFEHVWTTVRDKHWDLKLNGVDWQAVHDELRPKMEAAKDMDAAREIMDDMLARLKQSHFGIFPGDVYHDLDSDDDNDSGEATPGLDVRVLDGHAVVTAVEPGSPAAARNVKPGWEIVRAGKTEIPPMMARIARQFKDSTLLDLRLSRSVLSRLQGSADSSVQVDFLDAAGKKVSLDLDRVPPRGKVVHFGNLPPQYVWSEWRKPAADVGYVRFNMFMDPEGLSATMAEAIKGCADCKGFVIDLRGNPGGIGGLAMGLAGWFMDRSGVQLGTEYLRGLTVKFVIFPRPEPFRGPLAVLVDGGSASTAEIFAGGLKDLQRARIFGSRTAGAALPSIIERLPNGDGFQYAVANYISQGGKPLEGIGVIPDEEVHPTKRQLLAGQDPALDAAIEWIHKQK